MPPKIIERFSNQYGDFSVEELIYDGRNSRLLFSGPLHAAQSGIPLDDNPRMLFRYNQRLLELAVDMGPKNILLLGGGTMTLSSALSERLPNTKQVVVEQNADLIKMAERHFNFNKTANTQVVIDDAAACIMTLKNQFQLIIIDLYDNFTVPAAVRTERFALQLARLLAPDGVIAANCIAAFSGIAAEPLKQLKQVFTAAIGPVQVTVIDQGVPRTIAQNLLLTVMHQYRATQAGATTYVRQPLS